MKTVSCGLKDDPFTNADVDDLCETFLKSIHGSDMHSHR